jgi:glutathione S-transferase
MELWHSWVCQDGMRVRAALAEKGVPYRSRLIPSGEAIPGFDGVGIVLRDDAIVHVGPLAILEYLEAGWPEPPLFPAGIGREILRSALGRVDSTFGPHLPRIARGTPVERVRALRATERLLKRMDRKLPESGFLLEEFSVVDLALASIIATLPPEWRPRQVGLRNLARWEHSVMSRPAVRQQMAPVGNSPFPTSVNLG